MPRSITPPPLPARPAAAPPPAATWDICLLGGLTARRGTQVLTNFGSRAASALLARLALQPQREHPREELIEHLWPGVDVEAGRNRLRQTLFALRQRLETPGAGAAGAPLLADRHGLRVAPGALPCDVLRFEAAVRAGRHGEARALYTGELMPGFYDDWIEEERLRLAALFDRVEAAPPGPAPTPPSLPGYLTRFVGRDAEGARLRAEVLAQRLVTLLGPGGSGKTRLAVELAGSLAAAAAAPAPGEVAGFDQIVFTPLTHCQDAAQMTDAVCASVRLQAASPDAMPALVAALTGRRVMLVLDNAEHLGAAVRSLALQLLAALPGLHLLVTSRHVLGADGEREFLVAPLALPAADMPLERLAINPAVALFADRARAARSDFQLSDANRSSIVGLVHALEGMPLALELAASRLRSLTCDDMLALLRPAPGRAASPAAQPQLELLARAGPRAGDDPRHASMLRVVEWSWRQLAAPAERLLATLTVFHGGFTAAAAHAVYGEPGTHALIDDLVAHSLARVVDGAVADGGPATPRRFSLYEPVREYAATQLGAARATELRARHRAWMAAWAASHPHGLPLAALRDELPNLHAAMASALNDDAPAEALQPLLALRSGADELALPAPLIDLAEAALQTCGDALLRSRAHTLLGRLCMVAGRGEAARRHADAGLAGLAEQGDSVGAALPALRARALHAHASVRWRSTRDPQGLEAELDEAEALALQCGDTDIEAGIHTLRAFIRHLAHHDVAGGQALNERALALWERAGNAHAVNRVRYNLAVNASHAGRHAEALARVEQVAAHARSERDVQQLSKALNVQGLAQAGLRRWAEAAASYREAIRVAWGGGELHALGFAMWNLPAALARLRRPEVAARLAGFIGHHWRTHIGPLSAQDQRDLERHRRLAAAQCGRETTAALWLRGEAMSLADAVALASETHAPVAPARRPAGRRAVASR